MIRLKHAALCNLIMVPLCYASGSSSSSSSRANSSFIVLARCAGATSSACTVRYPVPREKVDEVKQFKTQAERILQNLSQRTMNPHEDGQRAFRELALAVCDTCTLANKKEIDDIHNEYLIYKMKITHQAQKSVKQLNKERNREHLKRARFASV